MLHLCQNQSDNTLPSAKRHALVLLLMIAALALLVSFEQVHTWLLDLLLSVESIIRTRPLLGRILFVLLAAVSAMFAFVSSAIIIPAAVHVWGKFTSMFLLWLGWILGGIIAYSISRYLGRSVVNTLTSGEVLKRYESTISNRATFAHVLLFQVALPSELPGYLLGLVRYPFLKYIAALMLGELPFAIATVYLGSTFLERRLYPLLAIALAVAAGSIWAFSTLHRRLANKSDDSSPTSR